MLKNSLHRDILKRKSGGAFVAVSYKKLFHMLIDRGITNTQLQKMAGYSANITTRLKNDTYISLESIEKICVVLNCGVDDILEFVPNQPI